MSRGACYVSAFQHGLTRLGAIFHDSTIYVLHLFYKFVTTPNFIGKYGINLFGKGKV
jgi:hypothetical protein